MRKFSTTLRATTVLLRSGTKRSCPCLVERDHLDVEDEGRVGGDAGERRLAVGQVGGDGYPALGANRHAGDTNVPALDDIASTELEGERLALLVRCGTR